MAKRYQLKFIIHSPSASCVTLKQALAEFGESIEVKEADGAGERSSKEFNVSLFTEDPTLVFDACSQVGRIKSVKVEGGIE